MSILLKLDKVNLKYQTGKDNIRVLKDINLTTKKKETISIVGESGSGKTSLIMLIGGLEKATSGKVFFQNHEITKLNEDEVSEIRKKNIGIIFQSFYLIPNYTAVENVALTLELNKFKNPEKEAKQLLDRFGLSHRFNNLPSQLSGGEQQRVAIARAIAMKPELILADEPTGNLVIDQFKFCTDVNNHFCLDLVLKFENLNEDFNNISLKFFNKKNMLLHLNKSEHKNYREYYDNETKDKIYKYCKKDIEFFKYEF